MNYLNPIPPEDDLDPPPEFSRFLKCRSIVDEIVGMDEKIYDLAEIAKGIVVSLTERLVEVERRLRDNHIGTNERIVLGERIKGLRDSLREYGEMSHRFGGKILTARRASLERLDSDDLGEFNRIAILVSDAEEDPRGFGKITEADEKSLGVIYERALPLGVLTEEQKEEIRVWNRKIARADFEKCEEARAEVSAGVQPRIREALLYRGMHVEFHTLADAFIHYGLGDEIGD